MERRGDRFVRHAARYMRLRPGPRADTIRPNDPEALAERVNDVGICDFSD